MPYNLVYMLNGISLIAVAGIGFYTFFKWNTSKEILSRAGNFIGIGGIFFLISAILNFMWFLGYFAPRHEEFILIKSVLVIIETIILLFIIYEITQNKRVIYFMFFFLFAVAGFRHDLPNFVLLLLGISYLAVLITSLDLLFFSNFYLKRTGIAGIAYSYFSLFLLLLIYLGKNPSTLPWFVSNIMMFFIFLFIFLDVTYCGTLKKKADADKKAKESNIFLAFIKFIMYITSICAFIFFSTVAVHEMGHALVAQYYGCENVKAVVYEAAESPHTEIICSSQYSETAITIGGVALTFIVGLIFLLLGGEFITKIAYLILGFALIIPYGDLLDLGVPKNVIVISIVSALIIIVIAVVKLSVYYLKQQHIFKRFASKEGGDVRPWEYLELKDGRLVTNLYELACALNAMDTSTYKFHSNGMKNEFSKWVNDSIGDEKLSQELAKAKDKGDARVMILKRLITHDFPSCLGERK